MAAKHIATLTMNPAIDLSYEVDRVRPTHKIRADHERYFPGGGGINVARVLKRLGSAVECLYLCGGPTGKAFDALVEGLGLARTELTIAGPTRVATAVLERESAQEYRFTPAGPEVSQAEWQAALATLEGLECDILVASGSLPRGVPADFYAQVARLTARRGIAFVLDTSGEPLRAGIEAGGILLAKPSLAEFQNLAGQTFTTTAEVGQAALAMVRKGGMQALAITLGSNGALLATPRGISVLPALDIPARSAVGAGDSFVAGMVHAIAHGESFDHAFRLGVAAGSAAVLTPGSDLAHRDDIMRLLAEVHPVER